MAETEFWLDTTAKQVGLLVVWDSQEYIGAMEKMSEALRERIVEMTLRDSVASKLYAALLLQQELEGAYLVPPL